MLNCLLKRRTAAFAALLLATACGGGGQGPSHAGPQPRPQPQPPTPPDAETRTRLRLEPTTGAPGDPVLITGQGLGQPIRVLFGTAPALLRFAPDDTRLYAIVPAGADPDRAQPLVIWPAPGQGTAGMDYQYLHVDRVPTLRVVLVPIVVDGQAGDVDDPPRRLEDWVARFRAMFPVAQVEVRKGPPLVWQGSLGATSAEHMRGLYSILLQLEARRVGDGQGASTFYYGVVHDRSRHGFAGMGQYPVPGHPDQDRCAVGGDWAPAFPEDNRSFPLVFAHEMGHVLGCLHAPSNPPDAPVEGVDPEYPYPGADIGAFGFDVAARSLKAPGSFKDIMSYTPPQWVSDYHYRKTLDFLVRIAAAGAR